MWFSLSDRCTGSLMVLSCVQLYVFLSFVGWVSGNTTQGFYFVFIRSLEPFYIPCCVLQYGHLGYGHYGVYVICVCVCSYKQQTVFNFCCFDSYYNTFICLYSFNSWFLLGIMCETNLPSPSHQALPRTLYFGTLHA
jgi:hypothetical protein